MGTEEDRQKWGQARGSEALYLRAGRRGPGRGAPGSPAQARRRSGRSTGGGLVGGGGGNPPPIRNCLLTAGAGVVRKKRRRRGQILQTLLELLTFCSSRPTPPLRSHLSPAVYTVGPASTLPRLQTPPQLRPASRPRPSPAPLRARSPDPASPLSPSRPRLSPVPLQAPPQPCPASRPRPAPHQSRCRCWETHLRGWRGGEASGALGALTGPCPPRGGPGRSARWLASPVEVG